jgi:hypothetical protein
MALHITDGTNRLGNRLNLWPMFLKPIFMKGVPAYIWMPMNAVNKFNHFIA